MNFYYTMSVTDKKTYGCNATRIGTHEYYHTLFRVTGKFDQNKIQLQLQFLRAVSERSK